MKIHMGNLSLVTVVGMAVPIFRKAHQANI